MGTNVDTEGESITFEDQNSTLLGTINATKGSQWKPEGFPGPPKGFPRRPEECLRGPRSAQEVQKDPRDIPRRSQRVPKEVWHVLASLPTLVVGGLGGLVVGCVTGKDVQLQMLSYRLLRIPTEVAKKTPG